MPEAPRRDFPSILFLVKEGLTPRPPVRTRPPQEQTPRGDAPGSQFGRLYEQPARPEIPHQTGLFDTVLSQEMPVSPPKSVYSAHQQIAQEQVPAQKEESTPELSRKIGNRVITSFSIEETPDGGVELMVKGSPGDVNKIVRKIFGTDSTSEQPPTTGPNSYNMGDLGRLRSASLSAGTGGQPALEHYVRNPATGEIRRLPPPAQLPPSRRQGPPTGPPTMRRPQIPPQTGASRGISPQEPNRPPTGPQTGAFRAAPPPPQGSYAPPTGLFIGPNRPALTGWRPGAVQLGGRPAIEARRQSDSGERRGLISDSPIVRKVGVIAAGTALFGATVVGANYAGEKGGEALAKLHACKVESGITGFELPLIGAPLEGHEFLPKDYCKEDE